MTATVTTIETISMRHKKCNAGGDVKNQMLNVKMFLNYTLENIDSRFNVNNFVVNYN